MAAVPLLLLLVALCCGSFIRPIWYHPEPKTWTEARIQCQSDNERELLVLGSEEELVLDMDWDQAWVGFVPHDDHFHVGKHGSECGLATKGDNSVRAVDCSSLHFFLCSGDGAGDVFVPQTKTWSEAESFCEDHGQEISRFSCQDKAKNCQLGTVTTDPWDLPVWIGGQSQDPGSPPSPVSGSGSGSCLSVGSRSKSVLPHSCSEAFPFLCSEPGLVLLQELLSWEEAEQRCQNLSSNSSYRLLSVDHNSIQNIDNVLPSAQTNKVWVGLRFLAGSWFWLDGEAVTPPLSCPAVTLGCGALVLSPGPEVEETDCSEKLNPLCYHPPL